MGKKKMKRWCDERITIKDERTPEETDIIPVMKKKKKTEEKEIRSAEDVLKMLSDKRRKQNKKK